MEAEGKGTKISGIVLGVLELICKKIQADGQNVRNTEWLRIMSVCML